LATCTCTIVHTTGSHIVLTLKALNLYMLAEDGRNAAETGSQKLLNVLALTMAYFIVLLLCLT